MNSLEEWEGTYHFFLDFKVAHFLLFVSSIIGVILILMKFVDLKYSHSDNPL